MLFSNCFFIVDYSRRKLKTIADVAKTVKRLKEQGKKVVLCHGVFDLLHPGHLRHFESAKKYGDVLIVTITADKFVRRGPGRPVFNDHIRADVLAALEVVDYVSIIHEPTAIDFIKKVKPSIYAKGPDYRKKDKDITGKIYDEERAIKSVGGKIVFTNDETCSSSQLINNHLETYPPETSKYLSKFGKKYSIDDINSLFESVHGLRVLVIGDAIIDQYHYCASMGRSSKEPIVANKFISDESFAGGVLATANHVAEVVNHVDLVTLLGKQDSWQKFIKKQLATNIVTHFIERINTNTTIKRRYVLKDPPRKLFEVCFMNDNVINRDTERSVAAEINKLIAKADLVVVNDFGHGFLTPRLIDLICKKAKILALNVQTNSANAGFNLVTKYPKANMMCVDEVELRYATHDKMGDLKKNVRQVQDNLKVNLLITTRGATGSLIYSDKKVFIEAPALTDRVVDAVGAGDALFAYTAPCFAAGAPPDMLGFIGNAVGALAVQIVGNRQSVEMVDVIKYVTRLLR